MVAWLGLFALSLGFCGSLASGALWARHAAGRGGSGLPVQGSWMMLASAVGAAAAIEAALLNHDFSVRFVAENGSLETPVYYTVTSLWSSLDGSLLLWLVILAGYTVVHAHRAPPGSSRLHPWAMTVLCGIACFFFGLELFSGHAFDTISPAPSDGPGPNPLLADHPAMGVHPPLLYLGFVGLTVPFAYAIAGLATGELGREWLATLRRTTLVAWIPLTAGITMGAWWSYAVLGWGGYWAWDPVENASLLPWLVATALLHSAMVQRRRGALAAWNVALAVAAFLLVCIGTFLTRSDVVDSVHSFTQSAIGPTLLGFVAALGVLVTVLVGLRAGRLGAGQSVGPALSRGTTLLLNNVVLTSLTVTVLLGTLYPLIAALATGQRLSIGPPYYDRVAVPLGLLVLLLMSLGPLVRWDGERPARLLRRYAAPAAAGCCTVVAVAVTGLRGTVALLAFGLAATVIVATGCQWLAWTTAFRHARPSGWTVAAARMAVRFRHRNGGLVAHLGLAVLVIGVTASSAYASVSEQRLSPGDRMSLDGVSAQLVGVSRHRAADSMSTAARLRVSGDGDRAGELRPELRYYPGHQMVVTRPAVRSRPGRDVYLTLLAVSQDGTHARVRLAVNPLVGWIWAGGALTALGGLAAALPRRRRRRPVPSSTLGSHQQVEARP